MALTDLLEQMDKLTPLGTADTRSTSTQGTLIASVQVDTRFANRLFPMLQSILMREQGDVIELAHKGSGDTTHEQIAETRRQHGKQRHGTRNSCFLSLHRHLLTVLSATAALLSLPA